MNFCKTLRLKPLLVPVFLPYALFLCSCAGDRRASIPPSVPTRDVLNEAITQGTWLLWPRSQSCFALHLSGIIKTQEGPYRIANLIAYQGIEDPVAASTLLSADSAIALNANSPTYNLQLFPAFGKTWGTVAQEADIDVIGGESFQ